MQKITNSPFPVLNDSRPGDRWLLYGVTLVLLGFVSMLQVTAPRGVDFIYLYIAPVLMSLWSRRRYYALLVAAIGTVISVGVHYAFQHHHFGHITDINLGAGIFAIWVTAIVCALRNQAEQRADANRRFVNGVLKASPDVHWVLDLQSGKLIYVSGATTAIGGYDSEDFIGSDFNSLLDVIHPEDQARFRDKMHTWLSAGDDQREFESEYRARHRDGSWRWVRSRSRILRFDAARQIGLVAGTVSDVTQLKATEQHLLESGNMLRNIIDAAPLPVFTVDAAGSVVEIWNPAAARVTGWSREEVLDRIPPFLPENSCERYRQHIASILDGRRVEGMELATRRKNGAPLDCLLYGVPAHDACGGVRGGIFMLVDQTESKRNHELVQTREREMRTLMGNLPGMVYRCRNERDWTVDYVNEGCRDLTGYEPYQLMNNAQVAYNDLIHPDDRERVWEEVQAALETGATFRLLYRIVTAAGKIKWVSEQGQGVHSEDGEILFLEGFIADVTEREQAQVLLRQSEEKYRSLFEAESDAVILADAETMRFVDANSAALTMYGYARSEFLRLSLPDLTLEQATFRDEIAAANGLLKIPLQQHARKDGSLFSVELSLSAFQIQDRDHLLIVARDITERQRTEEALRESQERFRNLSDSAPVLIYMAGVDRHCYYFNRTWLNFTGRTLQTEYGKGWHDSVHPDDAARLLSTYRSAFKASRPYSTEFRLLHGDGTYHWLLDIGTPRFSSNGVFVGYIGTCTDITDRKRTEDNVRESELRYRQLFERQINGVGVVDLGERFVLANPAADRIFGLASGRLCGRNLMDFVSASAAEKIKTESVLRKAGQISSYDLEITGADGIRRTIAIHAYPNQDAGGNITGTFAMFTDVTEQRRWESALREERRMFVGGPMVVFNWGVGAYEPVEYVSPNVREQFGYEPEDFISGRLQYAQLVHPDDRERTRAEIADYTARDVPFFTQEYRLRRADGHYSWVNDFTMIVRNAGGDVTNHYGYIFDISARKSAEATARRSESRQRLIIDCALDCIISVGHEGRIIEFNPAAERTFGYRRDEVIGKRVVDLLIPERLRKDHIAGVKRYATTGQSEYLERRIETTGLRADGSEFPIEIATVHNTGDDTLLFTAFIRDISDRKATHRALEMTVDLYRRIAEVAPFPMVITRMADAQVLFANEEAIRLFGATRDDFIDIKSTVFYANAADRQQFVERIAAEGALDGITLMMKKQDGTPLRVAATARPFELGGEQVLLVALSRIPDEDPAARPLADHIEKLNRDVQDALLQADQRAADDGHRPGRTS